MDMIETRLLIDVGGWLGAVLVLVAYYYWALPSFSINVVWMGIALIAMFKVRSRSPSMEHRPGRE